MTFPPAPPAWIAFDIGETLVDETRHWGHIRPIAGAATGADLTVRSLTELADRFCAP